MWRPLAIIAPLPAQVSAPDSQQAASVHGFGRVEQKVEQLQGAVTALKQQLAEQKAAFQEQHALCKVSAGYLRPFITSATWLACIEFWLYLHGLLEELSASRMLASNVRQEDRQRCDALSFYSEHAADVHAGELGANQPLPPPVAALHDAIVADATALRAKLDELRDVMEVKNAGPHAVNTHVQPRVCNAILCILLPSA